MITDVGSLLLSVVCFFRYICRRVSVHSRFASMHSTLEERLRRRRVVMPARFNNASAPSTILRRSSASSLHRLKWQTKWLWTQIRHFGFRLKWSIDGNQLQFQGGGGVLKLLTSMWVREGFDPTNLKKEGLDGLWGANNPRFPSIVERGDLKIN